MSVLGNPWALPSKTKKKKRGSEKDENTMKVFFGTISLIMKV
jgi:hypothetical protein